MSKPKGKHRTLSHVLDCENLTQQEQLKLIDVWHEVHNQTSLGHIEAWYRTVCRFVNYLGYVYWPVALMEAEAEVMRLGLSKDYIAELIELIDPSGELTEEDRFVALISSSSSERIEALGKLIERGATDLGRFF